MMTWNESYHCLNRLANSEIRGITAFALIAVIMLLIVALSPGMVTANGGTSGFTSGLSASASQMAQTGNTHNLPTDPVRLRYMHSLRSYQTLFPYHYPGLQEQPSIFRYSMSLPDNNEQSQRDTVPSPSSVMRKSMILPGWGQVVNQQIWKVPIIYGMLAGLAYYSIQMDQSYRDYRAAFYNSQNPDGDQRFGPTPPHIDPNQSPDAMRYNRNVYRNRRDLTIIGVILAYGLNIVDAYVFAHMRDFDVSDDLSAGFQLGPAFFSARASESAIFGSVPDFGHSPFSASNSLDGMVLTLQIALR